MADNKGASDLDVFEGLTKKPAARPSFPPPGPPASGPKAGPPPMAPPPLAPPPGGRERPKTMLGLAPPPSAALPPPTPPVSRQTQSLPPAVPPPSRVSMPGGPPGPPPPVSRGNLPPLVAPPSKPPAVSGGMLPPLAPPPMSNKPPTSAPAAAKGAGLADMDWDDEDEKTSIYDKDETQEQLANVGKPLPAAGAPASSKKLSNAAALMAGSGGAAAAAPLPAPLPPPAAPPPVGMAVAAVPAIPGPPPPPSRLESTQVVQKPTGGSKAPLFAFLGVLGLAAVAGGVYMAQPKRGTVIVAVKSGGRSVETSEISINGKKVCDKTPCRVPELDKGTVIVKASAPGYEAGDQMVAVRAGEESPVTIELARAANAASGGTAGGSSDTGAPAKAGTGFKVAGSPQIKLSVDGKEIGPLPQEIKDATPGEHKLKFAGSDRYKADERTVTVAENQVQDLGTVKLKVLKGKATLTLETTGARVTLVSGADRKAIPQFPISVDIDTSKQWVIEATKIGFDDFKMPISFDDGEAEKTFAIALNEKGKKKPEPTAAAGTAAAATTAKPDDKKPDGPTPASGGGDAPAKVDDKKVADTGQGTLNINSIPPSNCVLDGRPLGPTPKTGVSVSAGSHRVTFIHPEKGRKEASVTVKGGETKTVAVKF